MELFDRNAMRHVWEECRVSLYCLPLFSGGTRHFYFDFHVAAHSQTRQVCEQNVLQDSWYD